MTETRTCKNCEKPFFIDPDDFAFYEKIAVPSPTWCPECRLVRRLAWRNERTFHKRVCDLCKRPTISLFAQGDPIVLYCNDCWWSDKWDGLEYGRDYDPARPFFEQIGELLHQVPFVARHGFQSTLINSEYTNAVGYLKNCYLITQSDYDENCAYGSMVSNSKDCFDNLLIDRCELCYNCVNCRKCSRVFHSIDCEGSYDLWYSRNCVGCNNCFGCVDLRNKQYHIFNEPCSKDEYERKIKEIDSNDAKKLWNRFPQKYMHGTHNKNVSGDYTYHSKNVYDSYIVTDVEDSRFCSFVTPGGMKDCYDFTHYGVHSELLYEALQSGEQCSRVRFTWWACIGCQEIDYSIFIVGCKNMFGCIGIRKKDFCILNRKYPEGEYHALRARIIEDMKKRGEWGEFFPIALSPYPYNETSAQEFFPLTKEQALAKGYRWREREKRTYTIGGEILGCDHKQECAHDCTGAFLMIQPEKDFLARFRLPAPTLCPNCRHHSRLVYRNLPHLYDRVCAKCTAPIKTSYAPDPRYAGGFGEASRPEIVYCERCYQTEVV